MYSSSPLSSSPIPQRSQNPCQNQTARKKNRVLGAVSKGDLEDHNVVTMAAQSSGEADHAAIIPSSQLSMDALPVSILSEIAAFAGGSFSAASRTALKATREVHLKIDSWRKYRRFFEDGFFADDFHEKGTLSLLIGPAEALRSERVVAHITSLRINRGMKTWYFQNVYPPWPSKKVDEAFDAFMGHTIPTLRSVDLTVEGGKCPVLNALVPDSSERFIVAPNLTRVVLRGQPTLVHKAATAINAGLWPALEELSLSGCQADARHFERLASVITSGRLWNLRLLNWDNQSLSRKRCLDDVILSALASRLCPLIESLSFTKNRFCPEYRIDKLGDALRACSNLRVLKMDCSRSPARELQAVTSALEAGDIPRVRCIYLRATKAYNPRDKTREGMQALRRAAGQRSNSIEVHMDIKTRA